MILLPSWRWPVFLHSYSLSGNYRRRSRPCLFDRTGLSRVYSFSSTSFASSTIFSPGSLFFFSSAYGEPSPRRAHTLLVFLQPTTHNYDCLCHTRRSSDTTLFCGLRSGEYPSIQPPVSLSCLSHALETPRFQPRPALFSGLGPRNFQSPLDSHPHTVSEA